VFAKRVNSTLADRQQHDAQEFQIYLLDALHEDTNRVSRFLIKKFPEVLRNVEMVKSQIAKSH